LVAVVVVPWARADVADRAARALRLDPGARLGGNTQVATARGARLFGVPRRVNFMVAFGARERIRGGAGHDELGSRGSANQVHGGPGNDLLHGGRGDVLDGGAGNDLIIDTEGGATVRGGPGRDRVIRARPRRPGDVCGGLAHDALVYADRSDTIAPSCRRHHSRVLYRPVSTVAPRPGLAAQLAVSGDGSNGNPYTTAACDQPFPVPGTTCTVTFPSRSLKGFWSSEFVPAYQCPQAAGFPYLFNQDYAPFGTLLFRGVEVRGLGPVGVVISSGQHKIVGRDLDVFFATLTGPGNSGATNWDGYGSSYTVVLHCTSDPKLAVQVD
jgi:Ca2+-binding RTX toxin-like protein